MKALTLTKAEKTRIRELVAHYTLNRETFDTFLQGLRAQVLGSRRLRPFLHSLNWRSKDPRHLNDKLRRKFLEARKRGRPLAITKQNLFLKINDLAGLRLLHLHTRQFEAINQGLRELFKEESYRVIEGPTARTWDDESRAFFAKLKVSTQRSPSLYTSVHYVIRPNVRYTCEIQVRTLMEEVWGEVDHIVNYPHRTNSVACREQIAALARATSTCSRLVDSIFRSHEIHTARQRRKR